MSWDMPCEDLCQVCEMAHWIHSRSNPNDFSEEKSAGEKSENHCFSLPKCRLKSREFLCCALKKWRIPVNIYYMYYTIPQHGNYAIQIRTIIIHPSFQSNLLSGCACRLLEKIRLQFAHIVCIKLEIPWGCSILLGQSHILHWNPDLFQLKFRDWAGIILGRHLIFAIQIEPKPKPKPASSANLKSSSVETKWSYGTLHHISSYYYCYIVWRWGIPQTMPLDKIYLTFMVNSPLESGCFCHANYPMFGRSHGTNLANFHMVKPQRAEWELFLFRRPLSHSPKKVCLKMRDSLPNVSQLVVFSWTNDITNHLGFTKNSSEIHFFGSVDSFRVNPTWF